MAGAPGRRLYHGVVKFALPSVKVEADHGTAALLTHSPPLTTNQYTSPTASRPAAAVLPQSKCRSLNGLCPHDPLLPDRSHHP